MPNLKPTIPYPSRRNDERRHEKANDQIEKFYKIFKDLSFEISLTDALILMPKFASTLKALIGNKEKLSEMARTPLNEHCSAVILSQVTQKLRDLTQIPHYHVIFQEWWCLAMARSWCYDKSHAIIRVEKTFSSRAHSYLYSSNYDDMTANRVDVIEMDCEEYSQEILGFSDLMAFLALEDDPTSPEVDDSYYDSEGYILLLEAILNSDPSPPPPNQGNYLPEIRKELKVCEAKTDKSSIDEPLCRTQDLLLHLDLFFWRVTDKFAVHYC
ncbi:hypothetical protein Tco_1031048 [Tanacetum coccineum]|uniref:Reverse transcriptase domain-containing protein n=1 Tax=Tanacetum coccineum TaxID=301880 RepID=A0ABQ5G7X2_9ASTR